MNEPEQFIWINNWEKFQTYQKKRGQPWAPPWIRLYPDLWTKDEFLDLPELTRLLLCGLFVAFSSTRGRLSVDTRSLSRRLHQHVTVRQLRLLNHAGFISFCSRTVLEHRWNMFQNGSVLEVEVEVEVEEQGPFIASYESKGQGENDLDQELLTTFATERPDA